MDILEKVAAVFRKREAKRIHDFAELVAAVADNAPPSPEVIAEALDRCGKTAAELSAALDYRRGRQAMRAKLDGVSRLESELGAVQDAFHTEQARWQKLEAEHAKVSTPLVSKAIQLEAAIREGRGMAARLRATYVGPLTDELQTVEAQAADVSRQIAGLRDLREQHALKLERPSLRGHCVSPELEKSLKAIIAGYDRQIEELETEARKVEQERVRIEGAMCEP